MSRQRNSLIGEHVDHTPEELHAIIRRAHLERTEALGQFFAGLFRRNKKNAPEAKHILHLDAAACG
jgi:hypothetical protein